MAPMRTRSTRRGVQGTTAQINLSSSTTTGDVQPPPSQLVSMPSSLGDAEGDEDNTNSQVGNIQTPSSLVDAEGDEDHTNSQAEGGSTMPKKGQGKTCAKSILKAIAKNMAPMPPMRTRSTRRGVQGTTAQINLSSSRTTGDVQPPPSHLASMPSSLGDIEGDEDNTNSQAGNIQRPSLLGDAEGDEDNTNSQAEEGSTMLKKGRGKTCGKSILNAIAKNGGRKLQIMIPEHLARPVENASLLATGIGIIIRYQAPVINIKRYDDIPSQDKEQIYEGLKAWFEFVDIETDPLVKDKLDEMLRIAFRHWKNKMHKAYNELKDAGQNPIDNCPFDWFEEGVWEEMCRSFEEPKYKRRSDINKLNRRKLSYPHSSGSQPFHVRYYRMAEAERSLVKNWRDCHTKKNGRMVNDKAELLVAEMDTRKRQRSEAGEAVEEEDILAETLGRKTGYRKGMGYGFVPPPPTKHIHIYNSEGMKKAREQLQEQQSQLLQQQTQIENQKITIEQQKARIEEQSAMIEEANSEIYTLDAENDTLHSELTTLKEKHKKLEAKLEKMLRSNRSAKLQ